MPDRETGTAAVVVAEITPIIGHRLINYAISKFGRRFANNFLNRCEYHDCNKSASS
jgi:hypothetical protein